MKIIEQELQFQGLHSYASKCGLTVYDQCACGKHVVIFTELPDNPGTSVTSYIENLIHKMVIKYKIPDGSVWIEHYPPRKGFAESYSVVTFVWDSEARKNDIHWKPITKAELTDLLVEKPVI